MSRVWGRRLNEAQAVVRHLRTTNSESGTPTVDDAHHVVATTKTTPRVDHKCTVTICGLCLSSFLLRPWARNRWQYGLNPRKVDQILFKLATRPLQIAIE